MRLLRSVWDMRTIGSIFNSTLSILDGAYNMHSDCAISRSGLGQRGRPHTSASNPLDQSKRRLRVGRKGPFFSADTPKVRLRQRSNFRFRVLPLHIQWRGPEIKRDLLATPFQYLFL